jgi:hypothetical protein
VTGFLRRKINIIQNVDVIFNVTMISFHSEELISPYVNIIMTTYLSYHALFDTEMKKYSGNTTHSTRPVVVLMVTKFREIPLL